MERPLVEGDAKLNVDASVEASKLTDGAAARRLLRSVAPPLSGAGPRRRPVGGLGAAARRAGVPGAGALGHRPAPGRRPRVLRQAGRHNALRRAGGLRPRLDRRHPAGGGDGALPLPGAQPLPAGDHGEGDADRRDRAAAGRLVRVRPGAEAVHHRADRLLPGDGERRHRPSLREPVGAAILAIAGGVAVGGTRQAATAQLAALPLRGVQGIDTAERHRRRRRGVVQRRRRPGTRHPGMRTATSTCRRPSRRIVSLAALASGST